MARTVTPALFFEQAMATLAGPGLPALRIGRLCAALGVTSGSFYHHFGSWEGFVRAFLDHWAREESDRVVEMVARRPDPDERVVLLKHLALALPHGAETAIRRWAGTDPTVAAAQERVDEGRRRTLREVLAPVVGDTLAPTLGEVGMSILVGHQQLHGHGPPVDLAAQLDQFELLVRTHAGAPVSGGG